MTGEALCCLTRLADHLGLSRLYNKAAEILIRKPWGDDMKLLGNLLGVPVFKQNISKVCELLHDAKRGALYELQVLDLCQGCGMIDTDIADVLDINAMQPAELHILLGILSDERRSSLLLLRKAVS